MSNLAQRVDGHFWRKGQPALVSSGIDTETRLNRRNPPWGVCARQSEGGHRGETQLTVLEEKEKGCTEGHVRCIRSSRKLLVFVIKLESAYP